MKSLNEFELHNSRASHPFLSILSNFVLEALFCTYTYFLLYTGTIKVQGGVRPQFGGRKSLTHCVALENKGHVIITRYFLSTFQTKMDEGGTLLVDLKCDGWTVETESEGYKSDIGPNI